MGVSGESSPSEVVRRWSRNKECGLPQATLVQTAAMCAGEVPAASSHLPPPTPMPGPSVMEPMQCSHHWPLSLMMLGPYKDHFSDMEPPAKPLGSSSVHYHRTRNQCITIAKYGSCFKSPTYLT